MLILRGPRKNLELTQDAEDWKTFLAGPDGRAAVEDTSTSRVERDPSIALPALLAHADWGSHPKKRWMCVATQDDDGRYRVESPEPVGDATTLLRRLRERAGGETVVAGFDFPIGIPAAYAERAGIRCFLDLLPQLGEGEWADFFTVASTPGDISLTRPFYPMRPGGTKQRHLTDALEVSD
ncbi:MAG: hypothetical protein HKN72_01165, partial [Gemmatimonadetes bacterium]|nr:hypothetical protein [Gemmatimonadota bacterium]